jgi:hypothetical protein
LLPDRYGNITYTDLTVEVTKQSKPLLMYLGTPCPHDPRIPAPEFRDRYDWRTIPVQQ